ncbi:hypothetical protein PTKIN_Ptkin08bG0126900 [Pterospermum kingtungense]
MKPISDTQEEAAEAYDVAAIKFRGVNAVTNLDITRYDVERIMASNTLLPGEYARRNKDIEPGNEAVNHNHFTHNTNCETNISPENNEGQSTDWKMVLHQTSEQQLEQRKPKIIENYKPQTFSLAPENMVGIEAICAGQKEVADSGNMGTHLFNASSFVTSLSSSREGSSERSSLPMPFAMPPTASKMFTSSANTVNSWIPSAQLRPALSTTYMPVFAARTDA